MSTQLPGLIVDVEARIDKLERGSRKQIKFKAGRLVKRNTTQDNPQNASEPALTKLAKVLPPR